ncbi:MAG: 30S ribosomal protein S8 [Nitrospirota bacterium]|jgi:small subunit ribosomal protein S8
MVMTDPIADLLTRIRNAIQAEHAEASIPHSNLKESILQIMQKEGYISGFDVERDGAKSSLTVHLKRSGASGRESALHGMRRVSTPGRRVYVRATDLPRVLNGLGVAVISTPQGLMTDREARHAHLGGEVLCNLW